MKELEPPYDEILEAALKIFNAESTGVLEARDLDKFRVFGFSPAIVRAAMRVLVNNGYVVERTRRVSASNSFLTAGQEVEVTLWELGHESVALLQSRVERLIPASDRVVRLSDNYPDMAATESSLEQLIEKVPVANDLEMDSDQRQVAVQELGLILAQIRARVIGLPLIKWALSPKGILSDLARVAGNTAISDVVHSVIKTLSGWLGMSS